MARSDKKSLWFSWFMMLLVFLGAILTNHKITWPLTLVPEVLDPIDEVTLPNGQKILLIGTAINPKNDYGKIPVDAKQGWNAQGIGDDHQKGLSAYIKVPGKRNTAFDKIAYATIGLDDPDSPYDRDDLLFDKADSSHRRDIIKSLLKKNILSLYFEVYPKSARSLTLRIYNEESEELASFEIENPDSVRTRPHQWEPEPLPIHRDVDIATISLVETRVQPARRKVYATEIERLYGIDAMSPKIPRIKESFFNQLQANAEMVCESPSNSHEMWVPIQVQLEDIEGNIVGFRIGYSGSYWGLDNRATKPIQIPIFHPNSKAWRLRASWVRTLDANYEPHEKIVLDSLDFSNSRAPEMTDESFSLGNIDASLAFLAGPSRLILEDGVLTQNVKAEAGYYNPRIIPEAPYARKKRVVVELGAPGLGIRFSRAINEDQLLSAQLIEHGKTYRLDRIRSVYDFDWGLPGDEELYVFALRNPAYDLYSDPIEFSDASLEIFLQDHVTAEFFVAFPEVSGNETRGP